MINFEITLNGTESGVHTASMGYRDIFDEIKETMTKHRFNIGIKNMVSYCNTKNGLTVYDASWHSSVAPMKELYLPKYATYTPAWQSYDHITFGDKMDKDTFDYDRLRTRQPASKVDTIQVARILKFPEQIKTYIKIQMDMADKSYEYTNYKTLLSSSFITDIFERSLGTDIKMDDGRKFYTGDKRTVIDKFVDATYNSVDEKGNVSPKAYPGVVKLMYADPDTVEAFKKKYGDNVSTYLYDVAYEDEVCTFDQRIPDWYRDENTNTMIYNERPLYEYKLTTHRYLYLVCTVAVKTDMGTYEPEKLGYIRNKIEAKHPDFYESADKNTDFNGEYFNTWKEGFEEALVNIENDKRKWKSIPEDVDVYMQESASLDITTRFMHDHDYSYGWAKGNVSSEDLPDIKDMPEIYFRPACRKTYSSKSLKEMFEKKYGVGYGKISVKNPVKDWNLFNKQPAYEKLDYSKYTYAWTKDGAANGSPIIRDDDSYCSEIYNRKYAFWHCVYRSPMMSLLEDDELLAFMDASYKDDNFASHVEDARRCGDDIILVHHVKPWVWRPAGDNAVYTLSAGMFGAKCATDENGYRLQAAINYYENPLDRSIKSIYTGPHFIKNNRIEWLFNLELVKLGWWNYDLSLASSSVRYNHVNGGTDEHKFDEDYAPVFNSLFGFWKNGVLDNLVRLKGKEYYYELDESDITTESVNALDTDELWFDTETKFNYMDDWRKKVKYIDVTYEYPILQNEVLLPAN